MTYDEAYAVVRDAIVTVMEVAPGAVTNDARLAEDLRCDSLALVEIADLVEEALPVRIEDADLDEIRTVGEAVDYVVARAR